MNKLKKTKVINSSSILMLLCIAVSVVMYCETAFAGKSDNNISFKWKANPSSENIVGYKLYYGKKSRFDANGSLKSNFKYDYCVDFTELIRCSGSNYSNCVDLGSAQLECQNLYTATPQCTLKNLKGKKYFSLTAYNYQNESSFTKELNNFQNRMVLSSVYDILLK